MFFECIANLFVAFCFAWLIIRVAENAWRATEYDFDQDDDLIG